MNFDNSHRQRQNHNNKRNRGRNNRRSGGGGGQHGGGGNSINRVYESNGPDVKVRGTAQTIAEKYMQLGRDAHSSGDNIMAESYYQFAEHYFRVLQSMQPPGQLAPQILRRPGEEPEEEVEVVEGDDAGGGDAGSEGGNDSTAQGEDNEGSPGSEGSQPQASGEQQQRQDRNEQRDGQQRERFRPRWQQRRDRGDYQPRDGQQGQQRSVGEGGEAPVAERAHEPAAAADEASGDWEAPSFLKRPVPQVEAAPEAPEAEAPRPRRGRPPRASSSETAAPSPQVKAED